MARLIWIHRVMRRSVTRLTLKKTNYTHYMRSFLMATYLHTLCIKLSSQATFDTVTRQLHEHVHVLLYLITEIIYLLLQPYRLGFPTIV